MATANGARKKPATASTTPARLAETRNTTRRSSNASWDSFDPCADGSGTAGKTGTSMLPWSGSRSIGHGDEAAAALLVPLVAVVVPWLQFESVQCQHGFGGHPQADLEVRHVHEELQFNLGQHSGRCAVSRHQLMMRQAIAALLRNHIHPDRRAAARYPVTPDAQSVVARRKACVRAVSEEPASVVGQQLLSMQPAHLPEQPWVRRRKQAPARRSPADVVLAVDDASDQGCGTVFPVQARHAP